MLKAITRTPIVWAMAIVLTIGSFQMAFAVSPYSETLVSGSFTEVQVVGSYAYCATTYGFTIIDFSNPANPQVAYIGATKGTCMGLAKSGNYLYLADSYMGILVYNVTTPASPVFVDQLDINGMVRNLTFGNNYLYGCLEDDGLVFINASDPTNLSVIGYYEVDGRCLDCAYSSNALYVAASGELVSYTVAAGGLTEVQSEAGMFYDVCVNAGRLYAAAGETVEIYTLAGAGVFNYSASANVEMAVGVSPVGVNVAVADGGGVSVITNTGSVLDTYEAMYEVANVFGSGTVIVASEGEYGAEVVNATIPTNLTQLADLPYPGGPRNSALYDGDMDNLYAYVAYYLGGVEILDVTDPEAVEDVGNIPFEGTWTYDVEIVGDYLFICNYDLGLYVYSLTNPEQPVQVDEYEMLDEGCRAIDTNGDDYLILVSYMGGIYKFDIGDPTSIDMLGNTGMPCQPRDVVVDASNDVAYVAGYDMGARIYDVAGDTPDLLNIYNGVSLVRSLDFKMDYLYVGGENMMMHVVDVSTPSSPAFMGELEAPGAINGVVTDRLTDVPEVFLCCWDKGVVAVDVSTPGDPVIEDDFDTHSLAKAATFYNDMLYISDSYGFYVCDPYESVGGFTQTGFAPDAYKLNQNYPNPFNPSTNMVFQVKEVGKVTITVYDIMGHQVAILADGIYSPGVYTAEFTGIDLPSGYYFAQMEAKGFSQTQKMLLLK